MYDLCSRRSRWLADNKFRAENNLPLEAWVSPNQNDTNQPLPVVPDTLLGIDHEISSLDDVISAMDALQAAYTKFDIDCRTLQLVASTPDNRPECQKYITKQDVDYVSVEFDGVERIVCKTIADELVTAFVGLPQEELTTENMILWYTRTCRFNISSDRKLAVMHDTIAFAECRLRQLRKECGIAYNPTYMTLRRSIDTAHSFWNTCISAWTSSPELPLPAKLLTTAVAVAGMPYGIFGVRPMRPIKQDF